MTAQNSLPADAAWREITTPGRFSGLRVVVTGAGSGIGLATTLRIAREGGEVIASDISADRLGALAAAHPQLPITPVVSDISQAQGIEAIAAVVAGRLDGLVNNAGIGDDFTPLGELDDALWERVLAVNLTGPFRLTRALLPALLRSSAASVVNVASEAALRGSCGGTAYTTSKHALVGLTKSAAFLYQPQGVRFNAVAPGGVATHISESFRENASPGSRRIREVTADVAPPFAQPAQLAASITYLLSRDATNITGVILPSDNGWSVI